MHSKSGKIGLQSPEKGPADGKRDTQARQERLLGNTMHLMWPL